MILLVLALAAAMPGDGDYVVFDRSKAAAMIDQCSRDAPAIGDAGWTPMAGDILAMEAALPKALARRPGFANAPHGWIRQYIGIVRNGRRTIYGNFVPKGLGTEQWRTTPFVVCDGGESFFGAEYDVVTKRFTQIAFNGPPAGRTP